MNHCDSPIHGQGHRQCFQYMESCATCCPELQNEHEEKGRGERPENIHTCAKHQASQQGDSGGDCGAIPWAPWHSLGPPVGCIQTVDCPSGQDEDPQGYGGHEKSVEVAQGIQCSRRADGSVITLAFSSRWPLAARHGSSLGSRHALGRGWGRASHWKSDGQPFCAVAIQNHRQSRRLTPRPALLCWLERRTRESLEHPRSSHHAVQLLPFSPQLRAGSPQDQTRLYLG